MCVRWRAPLVSGTAIAVTVEPIDDGTSPNATTSKETMSRDRPTDSVGEAVVEALGDVAFGAEVSISYAPEGSTPADSPTDEESAAASGPGPPGWQATITVRLAPRVARLLRDGSSALGELLGVLPSAGLRAAAQLRGALGGGTRPTPAVRRAVRDTLAAEILVSYFTSSLGEPPRGDLVAETIDYLIELSGTRVEAHDVTHGVIVADVLSDVPRLDLRYPADVRTAKRAPLLFDGRRSVLIVDRFGRARTELQRHRFDRLGGEPAPGEVSDGWIDSGSLVAWATRVLGGVGFFVRADRTIWTFVDGQPLLVRRGEHWSAFPVELAASIAKDIGGGPAAEIVARAAFMISARPQGAILAIAGDPADIDGVVSPKDRYDLRNTIDPAAMRPETRLHHLIDAEQLDEHTVARLGVLDGATVLDRDAHLIAYGAIVTSADSDQEGARTAAARTLSQSALVVLQVSVDGDITIFRQGTAVTTLLGHRPH